MQEKSHRFDSFVTIGFNLWNLHNVHPTFVASVPTR
jgi:hypothetical protein